VGLAGSGRVATGTGTWESVCGARGRRVASLEVVHRRRAASPVVA
jgi:hypothetical protein